MKNLTLLLLLAVISFTMSAQSIQGNMNQPLPHPTKNDFPFAKRHVVEAPRANLSRPMQVASQQTSTEVVIPPTDLATAPYRLNGYVFDGLQWELVSRTLNIGFDGNDVYLQGFSYYLPEAWIKGTLDETKSTVSFPMQYFGKYSGFDLDLYFYPITPKAENGKTVYEQIDAVFNYNSNTGTFVLSQDVVCYILENTSDTVLSWALQYDSQLNITPDSDMVNVPIDLETQEYVLSGTYMSYDDDKTWSEGDPLHENVKVGFDGDDIYIQGMCIYLPLAWIKGHREGDDYIFENGQYFGTFIYQGEAYPLYFMGCKPESLEAEQMVMNYNAETGELVTRQWYGISSLKMDVSLYDMIGNVRFAHIADIPAVPAPPEVLYYEYYPDEEFGYLILNIPTTDVDGSPLLTDKLGYQLFCDYGYGPEPYIFSADLYLFDEDKTTISYNFDDEMNFLSHGNLVVVYSLGNELQQIGVRSVYEGGGETCYSAIGWYVVSENDKVEITLTTEDNHMHEYFDLMGRRVSANKLTRGIYFGKDGRKYILK